MNWLQNFKKGWGFYVLAHGAFLLSVFWLAYAFPQKMSPAVTLQLSLFALMSVLTLSMLLMRTRWAIWLESLRILTLLSMIFLVGFPNAPGFVFGYLSLLMVAVSAAVVLNSILYSIFASVYEH